MMKVDLIRQVVVEDDSATRTVYLVIAALAVIGVGLVLLALWLIRQTRPERELLAPLERMADRSWSKHDPAQRSRLLDAVRPDGAQPLKRSTGVPTVDEDFDQARPKLSGFDDLKDENQVTPADESPLADDATDEELAGELTPTEIDRPA